MAARTKDAAKRTAASTKAKKDQLDPAEAAPLEVVAAVPPTKGTGSGGKGLFTMLRSSVKGHYADPLDGCTAWSSTRNERGKTARLDAIRLALTGAHPAAKRGAGLLALSADGNRLAVEMVGPAGTARYTIPQGRVTGDHSIVLHGHAVDAPLMPDLGLTTLTDSQLRQMLFARFPVGLSLTVPPGLSEAQAAFWQQAIVRTADDLKLNVDKLAGDEIARALVLGQLPGALAAIKRDLKRDIDRDGAREIERRAALVEAGPKPTTEEVEQALSIYQRALRAQEVISVVTGLQECAAKDEAFNRQLAQFTAPTPLDFAALDAGVEAAQRAVDDARKERLQVEETLGLYGKVATLRELHVQNAERQGGHTQCLTCGSQAELEALRISLHQIKTAVQPYDEHLRQYDARIEELHKTAQKLQRDANEKKRAHAQQGQQHAQAISGTQQAQAQCRGQYQTLALQWQRLCAEANVESSNAEKVQAFIQQATELQSADTNALRLAAEALSTRQQAYEQLQQDEAQTQVARVHLQALTALEAVAKQTVENETKKLIAPVEKAVNLCLPQGLKARLLLLDTDGSACCRFEVAGHDGQFRAYGAAPGRSWMALTLAVATAFLPSDPEAIRVVLLDDSDLAPFAPDARRELLGAFAQLQREGTFDHVFVACTQPETIPTGYLHYKLD